MFKLTSFRTFEETRFSYDYAVTYELDAFDDNKYKVYNKSTRSYNTRKDKSTARYYGDSFKVLYENHDYGKGINFQYVAGVGCNNWRNKHLIALGIIVDSDAIYNSDSSIISASAGLDLRLLWLFEVYACYGYAYFNKKLPTLYRYEVNDSNDSPHPVLKKENNSGGVFLGGIGINIPITEKMDFMTHIVTYYYNDRENTNWVRQGVLFGLAYKF